jgi:hypothetical protein
VNAQRVATVDAEVVDDTALVVKIDASLEPYVSEQQAEIEALARRLRARQKAAALLIVTTPQQKADAVTAMRAIKTDRADAVRLFKPIKQSIDAVKDLALAAEKAVLAMADGPVAVLTGRVTTFDRQVAAEAEAQRRAVLDAERKRIEAQLQAEREAAELRAREEAEAAALIAAHFGDDAVVEAPAPIPAVSQALVEELVEMAAAELAPAAPEKVAGFTYAMMTHEAVDDLMALAKAVVAGTVPLAAICANEAFIHAEAVKMGVDLGFPGVRVWTTQDPRVRR